MYIPNRDVFDAKFDLVGVVRGAGGAGGAGGTCPLYLPPPGSTTSRELAAAQRRCGEISRGGTGKASLSL